MSKHNRLWYRQPASEWLEGFPIGTGRLAAMVMGGQKRERVALNHEWLWKGANRDRDVEKRSHLLAGVRELLLDGKYEEGTRAGNAAFGGDGGVSKTPGRVDPYIPAGDLYFEINHGPASGYLRELDLDRGVATVSYAASGSKLTREYVAHLPEDMLLIRVALPGQDLDCRVWLDRLFDPDCELDFEIGKNIIAMNASVRGGISFRVECGVWCSGGSIEPLNGPGGLIVSGASEIILALDIGCSARGNDPVDECRVSGFGGDDWESLVRDHCDEHARNYGSMSLDIDLEEPDLPTDERIAGLRRGESDPALALLYFNFGRYLMCASSANAELPANLQGKWSEDLNPPWQADYHHDINLEMNYWIAEPCGMQKYSEALLRHIERFVPHARKAATDLYGCDGVWFPIQTDAWGRATPESHGWAVWIGAAPWLAQHMWWHYEYGRDTVFLRERCYPFLKEVAAFYETYMTRDDSGTWQIVPSQSPENRFKGSGDLPVALCVSAAMDVELAWDLLSHAVRASEILDMDAGKRQTWQDMLDRLPNLKIGSKGQLLEWNDEFEEVEPGHRHISHLFALYPGEQVSRERTPNLFRAAARSLELRMEAFGGHTGWSRAWVACCYARLGDGNAAFDHLTHLVSDFAVDSLLDLHPPRIFQIDGNLGGAAAVIEMLFQSYYGEMSFLPALPDAWPSGRVRGIRARNGATVDFEWENHALKNARVVAGQDGECMVLCGKNAFRVQDDNGEPVETRYEDDRLVIDACAGGVYHLLA